MSQASLAPFLEADDEPTHGWRLFVGPVLSAVLLVGVSVFGYSWFHSLAELFSVVIGVSLYLVALRTFSFTSNSYLLCVATGFFWSSFIDVFHTLTYEGMSKGASFPPDTPPLLWMCARSLQVAALLLAPRYLHGRPLPRGLFPAVGVVSVGLVAAVFAGLFPVAWVPGQGLTAFKIGWEWALIFLYFIAALRLRQRRAELAPDFYRVMLWVLALSIATELCFTWYVKMYGLSNMLGHVFKLWAYWLMLWVVSHHMLLQPKRLLRNQARLLQEVTSRVPGLAYQFQRSADGEYRFTFASPGAAEIFELTPDELESNAQLAFQRILPEYLPGVRAAIERSLATLTPWKAEWQAMLPRQGRRWHQGESSIPIPQPDGSHLWIGHIHDITGQKNLELELTHHRDHLAQLVNERTEELRHSMQQTEQAARAKSDFLSNMSHEIRTPLNAIIGTAQIGLRTPEAAPARAYLEQIQESGHLLLSLVDDILDMAKVEAGKLDLESRPVRLKAILQRAMRLTENRASLKGLDFSLECAADLPEAILADETRLTQVLVNLLGNAVKFTEQGHVRLQVSAAGAPGRTWLLFAIHDSGIGMSEEQMARLFQPFEQGDTSTTRRFGGSGLGLTISKRLVDLMQGSIDVASQPGLGSCFTVRIPVDTVAAPPAEAPVPQPAGTASRRLAGLAILAAEDDKVNQWVLQQLLEQEGARCVIKDDGSQALETLAGPDNFDIFLTDVQMPGLNGYETARRSRVLRPGLPVVGLTAYALQEERQRCLDAGMLGHVTKPVDIDTLVAAILGLVAAPGSGDEPQAPPAETPAPLSSGNLVDKAVDWPALEKRLAKASILTKTLESLLLHHENTPAELRRLAAGDDAEAVRLIAHNLRGVAGILAAKPAQQAAEQLENSIRDTRALDRGLVEHLVDTVETLLNEVRTYLATEHRQSCAQS